MSDAGAAILLGLLQGLTEFLPVSSTAHLALAERALGLDPRRFGLSFTVALHMGTLLAVLIYFAPVWLELLRDVLAGRLQLLWLLIVATIPAVVAALLFGGLVERELRDPLIIAAALVLGSLVMLVAERLSGRGGRERATVPDAAAIGLAQALALIPGLSRSGMTISAGIARGLRREQATRLSFLLSTPAVFGAGLKTALDAGRAVTLLERPDTLAIGFAVSFVSGIAAVAFLVRFLRRHSLAWFVPYRVGLALVIVGAVAAGLL
ncbi:undecaprenyl-diphosphate phosphatase [soil metagenome]